MKRAIVCASVLLFLCGCGGSSDSSSGTSTDSCSLDVSSFTNGADASAATSVWNCRTSGASGSYTFSFYDDGAGYSSALGAFTWEEVGCQQVDIAAYNGTNEIRDIEGSVASGIGTFTQNKPDGTTSTASCTIETL